MFSHSPVEFRKKLDALSERTPELKSLFTNLIELSKHQESIKLEVGTNVADPLYKKSFAFEQIMRDIEKKAIDEFNQNIKEIKKINDENEGNQLNTNEIKENDERNKKIGSILVLVSKLLYIVESSLEKHFDELNKYKNDYKNYSRKAVSFISKTAPFVASYLTGSIFVLFASTPISRHIYDEICDKFGLKEIRSGTVLLFVGCLSTLNAIQDNLQYVLNGNKEKNASALECIINLAPMEHPVLCTLDNQLYEREAIEKWLTDHRESPWNHKQLEPGQSVQSVLIECLSIKNAIKELDDKFKQAEAIQHANAHQEEVEYKAPVPPSPAASPR